MCTKKVRHRCWRCGARLVIDKLNEVIRRGNVRYECSDKIACADPYSKVSIYKDLLRISYGHY